MNDVGALGSDGLPNPHENSLLHGHESAENMLKTAFESGKLPHSLLISGPRGIGKATLAYRFARYVLKHSKNTIEEAHPESGTSLFGDLPDGPDSEVSAPQGNGLYVSPDDPVYKRVASRGHSDLLIVERGWQDEKKNKRKTSISVEDVRGVGTFMRLTPGEGGWRVVVVDAADEMNVNSANALLKILEEPPARALILLVAHSPGRLLPTIRSRCRRLALRPLEDADVSHLLRGYAPDISAQDRDVLVTLADGSIGRALEMAERGGLETHSDLVELLGDLPNLDTVKLHKLGDKLSRNDGEPAFRATRDLLLWSLSRVIYLSASSVPKDAGRGDHLNIHLASLTTLDRWLEVWEKITRLMERAEGANLDRKQVVLNVFHVLGQAVTH